MIPEPAPPTVFRPTFTSTWMFFVVPAFLAVVMGVVITHSDTIVVSGRETPTYITFAIFTLVLVILPPLYGWHAQRNYFVQLDERGLSYHLGKTQVLIGWDQIGAAKAFSVSYVVASTHFIFVHMVDFEKYLSGLSKMKRGMAEVTAKPHGSGVLLDVTLFGAASLEVAHLINREIAVDQFEDEWDEEVEEEE